MYVFVRQCVNAKEYITACELRIYVGCLPPFLANSCARERPEGIAEEANFKKPRHTRYACHASIVLTGTRRSSSL